MYFIPKRQIPVHAKERDLSFYSITSNQTSPSKRKRKNNKAKEKFLSSRQGSGIICTCISLLKLLMRWSWNFCIDHSICPGYAEILEHISINLLSFRLNALLSWSDTDFNPPSRLVLISSCTLIYTWNRLVVKYFISKVVVIAESES